MAPQSNLEYQTFWAPRTLSKLRCVEGQSQSRSPVSQPQSLPLPLNDSRGMISVPEESLDSSPRLASDRDDFIYISDDAASDMNDASHEPFDETLPSVQTIVQSLEDAEQTGKKTGSIDDCIQTSQHKDGYEVAQRTASSASPELEDTAESFRLSVDVVAECPGGVSTSTPRIHTSTPTSIVAGSQTSSPLCDSSLSDAASPQTCCTSMSAYGGGMEKTSISEIPCRVDSELHFHSFMSRPQPTPSPPDHGCANVGMTPTELFGPSQGLAPSKDDLNHVSDDAASNKADTSCDKPSDETLPSVQAAVQSFEEPGELSSAADDCQQMSKDEDKCEVTDRSTISTPPDHGQANQRTGITSVERASLSANVSPSTRSRNTVYAQTNRTCSSAASEGAHGSDAKKRLENDPSERADYESSAPNHTRDHDTSVKQPTSRMHMRRQNKRRRELSTSHEAEQSGAESSPRALDDLEYCPSTIDESEDGSDSPSGDEAQSSSKRRKFRTKSSNLKSQRRQSVHCESAELAQASEPTSDTQEDVHTVAQPKDAAFDEWILQDVVLKRTIMDGKATFLFQFDWDLCAQHGKATRKPGKRSKQQGQTKSIVKTNGRRRFTALEDQWLVTWKEEGLCWAEIHSRFCTKFEERSKEALQVRYCTRLKQCDDN